MSVFILFTGVSLVGDEHTGLSTKGGKWKERDNFENRK